MSLYPETIARCHHLKTNGTQCGSPALRGHNFCYFHQRWRRRRLVINANQRQQRGKVTLPVFEDADSIQVGLMEVTRLLLTQQIDHKTAGLLLYALQTASSNLRHATFEPELPTRVVIDRDCVSHRPLGATAWSTAENVEYDDASSQTSRQPNDLAGLLLQRLGLAPELFDPDPEDEDEDRAAGPIGTIHACVEPAAWAAHSSPTYTGTIRASG